MAETVQGFDGSVSSLGVFACGPGPIYSAIQKAFNKQLKCGGGPIKSVHYETFSFVL
jgi:predicted ferric reductase